MSMNVSGDFLRQLADELDKLDGLTANITSMRLGGHEVYLKMEDDRDGRRYKVVGITDRVNGGSVLREAPTVGGGKVEHTFGDARGPR